MANPRPPHFFRWITSRLVSRELFEEISGDLSEIYSETYHDKGKFRADIQYCYEALLFAKMYDKGRTYQSSNGLSMFFNYLKVAWRNLLKNRVHSFINITGLSIGLACVLIILLYIKVETNVDRFHADGDRIYRLQHVYGFINALAGPTFEREYADVTASLRINPWRKNQKIFIGDNQYFEDLIMADANFFTFFSFPLTEGDAKACLQNNNSIAISESVARKWFGSEPPIGKMITYELWNGERSSLQVTAVFEDIPPNSHLQFDKVIPFERMENESFMTGMLKSWPNDWVGTYVQLDPTANPQEVSERYFDIWRKYVNEEDTASIDFMPLEELYLESAHLQNDYAIHGNGSQVRTFGLIAIIILLIASINFVNLATAAASKRSKEVGLRKTVGADRQNLIFQFMTESSLVSTIAFVFAAILVAITISLLQRSEVINLGYAFENPIGLLGAILAVFVITTLATSIYPTLVLARFNPIASLKPGVTTHSKVGRIRKLLVIAQFATSISLIIASLIIYDQMRYVQNKELGFNMDRIVTFNFGSTQELRSSWPVVKDQLEKVPGVKLVSKTQHVPGDNAYYWRYLFEEPEVENPYGEGWRGFYLGENMIELLDLEVIKGRAFNPNVTMDSASFMLNESGWKQAIERYGDTWKEPIGKSIEYYTSSSGDWRLVKKGTVVGIVKDFHHHSLQRSIDPIVIHFVKGSKLLVKADPGSLNEVINTVQTNWSKWGAQGPFNYEYLTDQFNEHYEDEDRFTQFVLIFCMLAIGIACLGLYGLSMFTTQQRVKEIGVRKVLGASVPSLLKLLSVDLLKLVVIALVISIPISIYLMDGWLTNFAYRINISVWHVLAGIGFTLFVAQATISFHSIKSALANPTKALRTE